MKAVAFGVLAAAFVTAAMAQGSDPALDDLAATPPGPDELDILSAGDETDFPDIDAVAARKPVSVTLRALNKITAKYKDIVIDMGATANFGTLAITARFCDKRPPEEFPETTAFLEIADNTAAPKSNFKIGPQEAAGESDISADEHSAVASPVDAAASAPALPPGMIFSGWMFASTPALNALEHAVYDVWVIDCKTVNVES